MLRPAALPLLLALFLAAASASSEPRPERVGVRLDYQRGPRALKCPDATELRAEVAAGLGHDPFTDAGPWRLITTLNRRGDGVYVATTDLFDDKGASASDLDPIVGKDCRNLVKNLLAVRIVATLADPPLAPAPAPSPPAPPPAPPALLLPSTEEPTPPPPPAFRWRVSAAMGGEGGVLPTWVPTLALGIGARAPSVSLAFELRTGAPLHGTGERGEIVRAFSTTGSLVGCYHGLGVEVLFLCSVTSMGVYLGGPQRSLTADTAEIYFGSGARGGAEVPFASGRFAVFLQGEVLYSIHPLTLRYDEQIVWQSGAATGAVQAGLHFFF
jgi:hypothetical protein